MFTPKWKKEARHLVKGARKFINYKKDILKPERVDEINSRREDLEKAIKAKDIAKVTETSKLLRAACEKSLPYEKPVGWLEEVEVIFVAVVIALGLRAYYLQPFRIPTGSMQPTLNGIIGQDEKKDEWPALPVRVAEKFLRGRTYVKIVTDRDRQIAIDQNGHAMMGDTQFLHFFSRSEIIFADSRPNLFSKLFGTDPLRFPAPLGPIREAGFDKAMEIARVNGGRIPAGTVLCEGTVDSGDLVLVDKISYHFRKPTRGEVFVFDTIGIEGIQQRGGPQGAGSHYIKRLCGVPGDSLSIQAPNLIVNGKIASEAGIQRVIQAQGPYSINEGYELARTEMSPPGRKQLPRYLAKEDDVLALAKDTKPGLREYAALGDNTGNSLDSRYWGTVKEFNLVGPALFSLWPVTTGHWGFIR